LVIGNRRGIYKDTDRSTFKFTDYQLRCNIGVAMAVAPEMFDRKHARRCLEVWRMTRATAV
jgi:glycogen debranching enzyme